MEVARDDISLYLQQVKEGVHDPFPYDRLMIHFRKEKEYREELKVIKKGISVFTKQLETQNKQAFGGKKNQRKLHELSLLIGKKVGLVSAGGKNNYTPEPIARWEKRKKTVEAKLSK